MLLLFARNFLFFGYLCKQRQNVLIAKDQYCFGGRIAVYAATLLGNTGI
jgi:hypothetical protein